VQLLAGLKQLRWLSLDAWNVHEQGFGVGDDALGVLAFLPKLEQISLRLTKVTDEGMARLAVLKSLKCVSIPGTKVTDAGLAHLARLPQLEYLRLGVYEEGTAVTDEGMRVVGGMRALRYLDLSATKVGDEGLAHLAELSNLESLCIEETAVTNDGLAALAPLTNLKTLRAYRLGDGEIRDNGAAHLAKLPRLETLQANTELTNDGVIALAKAPRLKTLSLSHPQITDACCAALAAMPNLTELWFQNCPITDAGLEQISRSRTLEYLMINDAAITNEGLRHLKNLPKLVRLSIDMDVQDDRSPDDHHSLRRISELTSLTDLDIDGFAGSELPQLASLKNLTALEIGEATIADDAALETIGGLPNLEHLTIHGSVATDAGVAALGRLSNLNYLTLSSLATDDGLAGLHALKKLGMIQISSPYVTQAGLDRLAATLPSLRQFNKYNYRLERSEVTPSTKDEFWRRGVAEERADRDALEDLPPPALAVDWKFNVEEQPQDPFGEVSRALSLADLRGKVVLVHFWGAWYPPCRAQQPELDALDRKYADQGLEIVGVHSTSNPEQFPAFVEQFKIPWAEGVDIGKQSAEAWKVDVYPSYYLIDRAGKLRIADIFRLHLEPAIQALLAETAPSSEEASRSPQVADEEVEREEDERPRGDATSNKEFAIEVRPTTPEGRPAHDVYLTLWRELGEGEPAPERDIAWDDPDSGSQWVRERSAHPNDGRHSRDPSVVRFTFDELPAGRYCVSAMTYDSESSVPDPTPYGLSRAVLLGASGEALNQPVVLEVMFGGSRALTVEVRDAGTKQPLEAIAVRLRDSRGMPIVHGHGSGNFFERTGPDGRVVYSRLKPGVYSVDILGKQPRVNEFVEYEPLVDSLTITLDREQPETLSVDLPPKRLSDEQIDDQFPFSAFGRVTDDQGRPLAGVEVRAATGVGTLTGGGRVTTDADGRYKLYFGAGWGMQRDDDSPLGVGVQAAIITASKEGWYESNMNRQGDLRMTDHTPAQLEADLPIWGIEKLDGFIFPRQPKEVNFTLTPAAVLEGTLVHDTHELEGESLSLEGDELPPASSVLAQVTTGDDGAFRIDGVPLGKKWRFRMRVGPTWDEIETEPFELNRPGVTRCEVFVLTERTGFGAVAMSLHVRLLDSDEAVPR
jgi:thiol-disulfide isomerase/thioredoxin/Leucine-rich repeat (LRR) protein